MPTSYTLSRVNYDLLRNLLITLLCMCVLGGLYHPHAYADDFDNTLNQSSVNNKGLKTNSLAKQDEFLPVAEAFKVTGEISTAENGVQLLRLTWNIAPEYYLYKERFKFQSVPELVLKPIYSEGTFKFDEFAGKNMTVFYGQVTIDFSLPDKASTFDLRITSQGCADAGLCYPPQTESLTVNPASGKVTHARLSAAKNTQSNATPPPATEKLWLWQAMLFALFGGVILNLMPCVFPVLSIKVMSLVRADSRRLRLHGWAYTLGIVVCFIGFSSILLLARSGGEAIGWGFQLQSPGLITALAYLFFVMGLSMSGLIHFGTRWMGAGQALTQQSGLTGSFFTGVLAALVASPCTAPFMGAALGFALTQPAIACLSVFAALGLGMALPLLLLCYLPSLAERLPRPGAWMETLKEFLAFPLYLSAIWLLWVLGRQAGVDLMAAVCIGAIAIVFACWLLARHTMGWGRRFNQIMVLGALTLAIYLPWQMLQGTPINSRWKPYTPELLEELRSQGSPVFIDLTADWCLTCLANERVTLQNKDVEAIFDQYKVVTLKGDWTNRDIKISQLLEQYNRTGVPLYLWFPANRSGKADILPQLLTPSLVIETIKGQK